MAIKRDNTFETAGGMVETETNADPSGTVQTVRVGVGIPSTDLESIPFKPLTLRKNPHRINYVITLSDLTWWTVTPVSMGNPHLVIFVDDVDGADVPGIGSRVQKHHTLPNSCNVEFVQVDDRKTHENACVRTWCREKLLPVEVELVLQRLLRFSIHILTMR